MADSSPLPNWITLSFSMSQISQEFARRLSTKQMQSDETLSEPEDPLPDLHISTFDYRSDDTKPKPQCRLADLGMFRYRDIADCIFNILTDYLKSNHPSGRLSRLSEIHVSFKKAQKEVMPRFHRLPVSQWPEITVGTLYEMLDRLVAYIQASGDVSTGVPIQVAFGALYEDERAMISQAVASAFGERKFGLPCRVEACWTARRFVGRYE